MARPLIVLLTLLALITACNAETEDPSSAESPAASQADTDGQSPAASRAKPGKPSPQANDSASGAATTEQPLVARTYEHLVEREACELLTAEEIAAVTGTSESIRQATPCGERTACRYAWPRPNAEELRKAIVDRIADGEFGEEPFSDIHLLKPDFQLAVRIDEAEAALAERELDDTATVPAELDSEDEGESDTALETTMAQDTGQRRKLPDLGDAAWWSPVQGGRLVVQAGTRTVTLELFADEDPAENREIARALAEKILEAD